MKIPLLITVILAGNICCSQAQQPAKPEDTEVWQPVPPKVAPGAATVTTAPSDAIILFNGKDLSEWVSNKDRTQPAGWVVKDSIITVNKAAGNIETKRLFRNYQLHIEWRVPANITGEGQARGNSGLFLASLGQGDPGYELQILDSYANSTYVNGMAGSIYKQHPPLANPSRKPGEWQTYDVIWTAPVFKQDATLQSPANITVFFNGILVQNHQTLEGPTQYIGKPAYTQAHGAAPIKLQAHGDKSEPISFRNIWVREL
ncbi:protein of unknown function [Filimonas lacunae]|uniref:3-keto-alpha-glucoside-1,2-lyase/3-keto-2-hydroxy-glucal hydratase domain-containing protein n=1 Tax=Filimonas lacunae TaxID=477680 RepID=A0A173MD46_9BACT|nr:DUF1080 domain-containing protein [Filimonas lacunae]BAV05512.1 multi-domain protein [Filimonas lacunae]SIT20641.1 protein of unknown function [Filimonas lacunae]